MIVNDREVVLGGLPLEIQEAILSYLPAKDLFSVAKTSRHLSSLTKIDSLWTKLTLDWKDIFENLEFCKDLIQNRYTKVRYAEITSKEQINGQNKEFNQKLAIIMDLILKCKTLTSLKFDKNIKLGDSLLSKISEKSSLTRIELTDRFRNNRICSLSPLSKLINLQTLKLYNMGCLEYDNLFSSLKNLKIVEVIDRDNTPRITDSTITCLVQNNVQLIHLAIDHCSLVSSEGIKILAKACPNLQHVSMKKCAKLRDEDAIHLLSSCPELRHIGLSRVSDMSLRKILEVCPKMESVSLEGAWVTEKGITELLTSAPRIQNLDYKKLTLPCVANNFDEKFKIKFPGSRVTVTASWNY